jgi:hypothetical protein
MFDNKLDQFEDGKENDESRRTLKTRSQEIENKMRFEVNQTIGKLRINYGAMAQYVKYNNSTDARLRRAVIDPITGVEVVPALNLNYASAIEFWKAGLWGSVNRRFIQDRLSVTLGLRTDGNSFINRGWNPGEAISPRLSASYALTEYLNLNASVGRYAKIPIYTTLGLRDGVGNLVNQNNRYITCTHYVAGIEWQPSNKLRITAEGFYKDYGRYPVSVSKGISLANEGGNFGTIGNEAVASIGSGRSYGAELFVQQKFNGKVFATASYTLFWSSFSGANGQMVPSAWDTRHLVSAIVGRKFRKGWEIGLKFRYSGGSPYTPYDIPASIRQYGLTGQGVLDFNQLNTMRLRSFKQLDVRIDKKFNTKRTTIDVYLDVTNALLFTNQEIPNFIYKRNATNTGFETTDGQALRSDGSNAIPFLLPNDNLSVTPALGFIIEF